jgi:HK97 family phage major capsid protein
MKGNTLQAVIEQKGKLLYELKLMQEKVEKGEEIEQENLDKLIEDLDEIDKRKESLEKMTTRLVESLEPEDTKKKSIKEQRAEVPFRDRLDLHIRGMEYVDGEIRKIPGKTRPDFNLFEPVQRAYDWNKTDATGGYLAPDLIADKIAEAQAFIGGMVTPGVATWKRTTTGNKTEIPVVNDTGTYGAVVSGSTALTSGSAVTYSVQDMDFHKITSHIATIANELVQDAAYDVVDHVISLLMTRLYRGLNRYFTIGTGSSQPYGLQAVSNKTVDCAKRSIDNDDLLELAYDTNRAYHYNAKYMMAHTTVGAIRRLQIATTDVDERPLWSESVIAGEPPRLNGFPVIVNDEVDEINAYNYPVFFGDFSRFWIFEALPMKLIELEEYYKVSDQLGFAVLGRWAANLAAISGDNPIQHMRCAST